MKRKKNRKTTAGRPFGQLYESGTAFALMDEIQRQRQSDLLEAVRTASRGDIQQSLAHMQPRILEIADDKQRYQSIARAFAALEPTQQHETLVITGTNEARVALNQAIRAELVLDHSKDQAVTLQTLQRVDYTKAEQQLVRNYHRGMVVEALRDYASLGIARGQRLTVAGKTLKHVQLETPKGKQIDWQPARHRRFVAYTQRNMEVAVGDRLQFTQGSRQLGYQNRELAEVKGIDAAKNELVLQGERGKELRLTVAEPHTIDYGYATTTHGAQGATVDRVLVDLDTRTLATNAASYYVQISRARQEANIFTNDKARLPEAVLRHEDKRAALELTQPRTKEIPHLQIPGIVRGLPGLER